MTDATLLPVQNLNRLVLRGREIERSSGIFHGKSDIPTNNNDIKKFICLALPPLSLCISTSDVSVTMHSVEFIFVVVHT